MKLFFHLLKLVLIINLFSCKNDIKPNVVLIMVDDMNDYPEIFDGHPQAKTPNIKKLANSGVSFLEAYTNDPMCGPSRASMISGVYLTIHQIFGKNHGLKMMF